MEAPTPEDVKLALADFDGRQQKIVGGMLAVMIKDPERVRDREWFAERLTEVTLLSGGFDADTPEAGVRAIQDFLRTHAEQLSRASYLLFQRVALDMEPRADTGFTFDDAMVCGIGYLPAAVDDVGRDVVRDLGEQPLAALMTERGLAPNDLVTASTEQLTHKMVTRAMKGRRLTANTMNKVHRAWNLAASTQHRRSDLFDYEP